MRDIRSSAPAVSGSSSRKLLQERLRKCRNYPEYGDGEHWDWQCINKRSTSNEVKRAYYAEPLDHEPTDSDEENMTDWLFDELEPQTDLEKEYEHAQNAYFTIRYQEENRLGFLGTHKSTRKRAQVSAVTCRNCGTSFSSNNKLHRHLRDPCRLNSDPQHETVPTVVVESKSVIPADPTDGLADFHYAQVFWYVTPGTNPHISCVDSGFGNSAIDDELQ